jgi:hypothetical protein
LTSGHLTLPRNNIGVNEKITVSYGEGYFQEKNLRRAVSRWLEIRRWPENLSKILAGINFGRKGRAYEEIEHYSSRLTSYYSKNKFKQ